MTSSKSWLHKWKGFDDISATTLTCWNRSGSVNGSSCRWQSCYVCLEGERCPRSHQLIHVKLQVLMELQFFPTCTWTQRLQINSIHSPIFSRVFRYFLAVHLTAGTTLFSLQPAPAPNVGPSKEVVGLLDEVYHTLAVSGPVCFSMKCSS